MQEELCEQNKEVKDWKELQIPGDREVKKNDPRGRKIEGRRHNKQSIKKLKQR